MSHKIAPSLLSADFLNLQRDIENFLNTTDHPVFRQAVRRVFGGLNLDTTNHRASVPP